jgi:glycosyltransferase involved in cell wall biosynthesis
VITQDEVAGPVRRVLVVSPFVPDAGTSHGAAIAIGGMLSVLASRHEVGLVHLRGPEEDAVPAELAAELEFVHSIARPGPPSRRMRRLRLAIGLLRGRPMWVEDWWSPELADALRETVRRWQPDVVHLELSVMAPYLDAFDRTGTAAVLTVHDPAATLAPHQSDGWLRRVLLALDARAWRITERRALQRADAVIAFTERDADVLRRLDPKGVATLRVLPLGVDLPEHHAGHGQQERSILFVGSSRHPPNVDAAQWLCAALLPGVVARVPDAELVVIGYHPEGSLPSSVEGHVRRLGRVADVGAEMRRAAVVVAPLRLGGGMRVKVLEALAAGKAVVATSAALAGIDAVERGAAVRADTAEEFVAAVSWLLEDAGTRERLGRRAREHARRELAWPNRLPSYDALYHELVGREGRQHRRGLSQGPGARPARRHADATRS